MEITVLDLGSNSFQLLFARQHKLGGLDAVAREVEFVQLGSQLTSSMQLRPEAFGLAAEAVARLLERAPKKARQAPLIAVATGAVRNAKNGEELLDFLAQATGVRAQILSGEHEAALAYVGASSSVRLAQGTRIGVVDLGGGSTGIGVGTGYSVERVASVRLGVLPLVERLAAMPNAANVALDHLAVFVRRSMEPAIEGLDAGGIKRLFFGSGVARALRALVQSYEPAERDAPIRIRLLRELTPTLLKVTPEQAVDCGVAPEHLNTIGPTAVVLDVITELFELDCFHVADGGLREGIVLRASELEATPWPELQK